MSLQKFSKSKTLDLQLDNSKFKAKTFKFSEEQDKIFLYNQFE